jgi:very-short-patch-repair endonuclease
MKGFGDLAAIIRCLDIPEPVREYRFHPARRWRLDYAWPDFRLAVEIEGGAWIHGRHTRGMGFIGDLEKYNELTLAGWSLLRFTPKQVKDGTAIQTIHRWFNGKSTS